MLVINRDEWGGSLTTLLRRASLRPNGVDTDLADGKALLGCRVPYTHRVALRARHSGQPPRQLAALRSHFSVEADRMAMGTGAADCARRFQTKWPTWPLALNFSVQDALRTGSSSVIAEPPVESCTSRIISRIARRRRGCERQRQGHRAPARTENSKGMGNESYDFYVLLKSERMAGWPLPAKLREK